MAMGRAAAERCGDFGWAPRGDIDRSLVAETAQHPRFGMGHAWSRSAKYSLSEAASRMYLVLTVEGGFDFTVDGSTVRTGPGDLMLLDAKEPSTADTFTDTARFVWYLEPTFLAPGHSRFRYGDPVPTAGSTVRALTSMTNALLKNPRSDSAASRRHVALSFEHMLASVLDETGALDDEGDAAHRDGVFTAAVAAIEARFREPGLTVSQLARELGISVRHLHGAFARMGSTPRREVERRRTAEARRLSQGSFTRAEVAARSGFTSALQLSRALARAATADDPEPPH